MVQSAASVRPFEPATLTDLLDGGYRLLRSRPGPVLGLTALAVVPAQLLSGIAALDSVQQVEASFGPTAGFGNNDFGAGQFAAVAGASLLRSLSLMFLGAALTFVVLGEHSGEQLGLGAALRSALRRTGGLLGSWPLLLAGSAVATVACYLPLGVWLTFTAVVAPAVAAESLGPIAGIGRSFSLVRRRFWMSLGVVLLSTLVASVIGQIFTIIPQAIALALPSGAGAVVATVAAAAASTVTTGPLVLSCVLLYVDLRVRTEGLDLRQRSAQAFARAG